MDYLQEYRSPLGTITLASDGKALTGLWFEGQRYYGATLAAGSVYGDVPVFREAARWLDRYFAGSAPDFTPPLHLRGSPFRQAVWEILLTIPRGSVTTYGEIAAHIAAQRGLEHMSAQAVGGAVGHNPVSIIVPCHRVVGADGSLTGYAGGIERKAWLLALEGWL